MESWRRALAEDNYDLVPAAANHVQRVRRLPLYHLPDLRGAAGVGLCEAAMRFDPDKGHFRGFAWRRVTGACYDELRLIFRTVFTSGRDGGSEDTLVLRLPEDDDSDGASLAIVEAGYAAVEAAEWVRTLANTLPEPDRRVFVEHTIGPRTLAAVGADLGVTESRACQINRRVLQRLRCRI